MSVMRYAVGAQHLGPNLKLIQKWNGEMSRFSTIWNLKFEIKSPSEINFTLSFIFNHQQIALLLPVNPIPICVLDLFIVVFNL